MKRDFLTVMDLSYKEIETLLTRSFEMKDRVENFTCPLIGKSIGLIFEKSSTRTRVSFEVGIYQLGANSIYMRPEEIQLGRGETIADTAKVLSRYLHGVVIRAHEHKRVEEFAKHSTIPVINGLTNKHHPCQALADLMTIMEKHGRLRGIRLAYIGDGNNVANSLIEVSSRMQMDMRVACPVGYEPDNEVLERATEAANSEIVVLHDPVKAAERADVIYTDVWVSMGDKVKVEEKKEKFRDFQINREILSYASPDAIVLHCLPANRGEEITDSIIDSPNSAVFDQAENRLYTQNALLEMLIGGDSRD